MQENVLIVQKDGSVSTLVLNRPEKRNALSAELLEQLIEVLDTMSDDPSVRVIVIRGMGNKAFSAGYDIGTMPAGSQEGSESPTGAGEKMPSRNLVQEAAEGIIGNRCPVIAMIHGLVMGAASDIAVSCDLRLIADTARWAIPPVKLGVLYHWEGIQRLIDLVGVANAKELLLTGDTIDAQRAREMGLVSQVFPSNDLEPATYQLAKQIARDAPLAVSGLKTIITRLSKRSPLSEQDEKEFAVLMARCLSSYDVREGISAFREKRAPKFEGR